MGGVEGVEGEGKGRDYGLWGFVDYGLWGIVLWSLGDREASVGVMQSDAVMCMCVSIRVYAWACTLKPAP